MNEIIEKENIENMIYEIRGKQVMLDSDLAKLYQCSNGTKDINKSVKRNINRFPQDFYFQLNKEEYYEVLRFQFGTLELEQGKYSKYLPYVFTEQGVAMLASVLHTNLAEEVSVRIMRSFVKMRRYIGNHEFRLSNVESKIIEHDNNIKLLQDSFDKLNEKQRINTVIFDGNFYDAYSILMDIFNESNKEIIIIDNYAGKELLDILKNIDKNIIILSKNIDEILKKKYESQYSNVTFLYNDKFHDRFVLIDRCKLYSCGASFKDLGKKCFALNEIKTKEIIEIFVSKLEV